VKTVKGKCCGNALILLVLAWRRYIQHLFSKKSFWCLNMALPLADIGFVAINLMLVDGVYGVANR
jgi:hypothetical protein